MTDQRFDELTKLLGQTTSRRQMLRIALGLAGAALMTAVRHQKTAACAPLGQPCSKANPCCSGRCSGGVCICSDRTTRCGDVCVDLRSDAVHCGGCGQACPADQICYRGACKCPSGTVQCGDACVDTRSNADHCGACGVACPASACTDPVCIRGRCLQTNRPAGAPCDDGNACTQADTCDGNGTCTGGNPVACTALDQCHDAGVCDPATGQCSNPLKADGTACDDGDACTQADTCQAGVCVGANPVVCQALDACHDAGTCDPATGQCSNPPRQDGTACSDANACTDTDTCQAGVCTPGTTVVCAPPGPCRTDGVCNPATGQCEYAHQPDGTPCDDGDLCTDDICVGGVCTHQTKACDDDNPCTIDSCDPATGDCVFEALDCSDDDPCTSDYCDDEGVCQHEPIPGCGPCEDPGCQNGTVWNQDACACICPVERTQCQEVCTDTATDPSNCGTCGHDCNANASACDLFDCIDGTCRQHQEVCGVNAFGGTCACSGAATCCQPSGTGPCDGTACCCPGQTCCAGKLGAICCSAGQACLNSGAEANFPRCA